MRNLKISKALSQLKRKTFSQLYLRVLPKLSRNKWKKRNERILKLEADKCLLQEQVMSLNHANLQMQNSKEELEHYGRRLCLRINGVPVK